jgi:DNA-binding GntR family transcriptional regulator
LKNLTKTKEEIIGELREEIANLQPGQRLVELPLCERFGVTRTTVREVLRQLEQDGFIKIVPNVGAMVAEISAMEIEQTFDLLGVLDGLAARVATRAITSQQLGLMEDFLRNMENASTPTHFFDHNKDFHSFITALSENRNLIKFAENLRNQVRCFYFRCSVFLHQKAANNEHRKIVNALKERNPEKAEKIVRSHFLKSKYRLIKDLHKSL